MKRFWLAEIRIARGKTGKAVALEAGIAQQMYSAIETGQRQPSVGTAKKIAAVLGFEWTRFFEDQAEDSA